MSCHHFKALLNKNFLILKRTYILTIFEIVSPMIVFLVLLLTNSKFETEHTPIITDNDYVHNNCFSIKNNYIHYSNINCKLNSTYILPVRCNNSIIAFIGEDFPKEIEDMLRNNYRICPSCNLKVRYYDTILELNDYVESKNYKKMSKICFGISYQKDYNKYTFKLHFFSSKYIEKSHHLANIPSSNIDGLDPFRINPDFDSYDLYLRSGYLMIQKMLYDFVLKKETGNNYAEIEYNIIPEKYEEKTYNLINKYMDQIISIFILIAYAFPLSINIYRLIKEKESRAKELMKIMGMGDFYYYFSYFVIFFIFNIIHAIGNSIIVKYVLTYIEFGYLFILFFLYGLAIFSLIFFFQSFLEKANISIIFCLLVYSIMYFIGLPLNSNEVKKCVKIFFALLFPPINLFFGCNTLTQFQINYNKFNGRVFMDFKNYSIIDMYIMLIINFFLYTFIGFYLQNVLQHQYGFNKPWYFLCTKNFWGCEKNEKRIKLMNSLRLMNNNINNNNNKINDNIKNENRILSSNNNIKNNITGSEEIGMSFDDNEYDDDLLRIKNIKKYFGEKVVLEDVTFNLHKDEIFVLLGHNGAGKTTLISILTGLIRSTSGSVSYSGIDDILSPESFEDFRKILGVCPQHDVLFDDLTVEEHLELYCEFKSLERNKISQEIESVLNDIGLKDKRKSKASDLSGGQKRKLSIGLAIVGGSSIIFLDEPTSGMDITSRRNLWDILKRCLKGKIIILTTHFMEEAQILGNRIGILSEGKMQCIGTPLELIEKYTNSVNLNITKHSKANDDKIIAFVLQNFGDLDVNFENFNKDILFRIPTNKVGINWTEFFKRLDGELAKLNIKNYSISKSTLEDVFMNFSKIIQKLNKKKNKEIFDLEKQNDLKNSVMLFNEKNYDKKTINSCSKFFKDFKISFMKRFYQIIREKKTFILEIFCPILLTLIGCLVGYIEFLEVNKTFPLKLNQITNDTQIIYYNYDKYQNRDNFLYQLNNFRASEDSNNIKYEYFNSFDLLSDIINLDDTKKHRNEKSYIYYDYYPANANNYIFGFNLIISIIPRQSTPIYANWILNNCVRFILDHNFNKKDIKIEMINEPLPYTYEEIKNKKNRKQFMILFFVALSFSLIPSNFITIIIKERENNSKHLQIISGISLFGYWFNNYIFELIKYYFIGGICVLILFLFDFYEKFFYILYLEYGPAMISFTYLFSIIIKSEYIGQITVLLINLIFGALFGIAVILMRVYDKLIIYANRISYFLRIIPSFCFCYGYNQLLRREQLYILDKDIENKNFTITDEDIDKNIILIKNVGADFIYLAAEFVIYLIILTILENNLSKNCIKPKIDLSKYRNENNINIKESRIEPEDKTYAIKVQNLVKIYYDKCCNKIEAVKNISFNLDEGEIFGFLGTNGAGKTTTFKCLSNEIFPTYGDIFIKGHDITHEFNKVRNLIGYCPQFDTIFEFLTVYENLRFYGLVKGAKEEKLDDIIDALIKEMNLMPFKYKISGTLSGGNKRKLSVAIALICNPPIILLDEPSTGMDPEARRHMWKAIYNISIYKKKSTIIMTTHTMEEAESLCKKIGILVNGQFKCLGTSDEIKDQYGYGFEINLQIKDPNIDALLTKIKLNNDDKNVIIDKNSFDESINKYNLAKYKNYFQKNHLGGKLIDELNEKGRIKLSKIIIWIYYSSSVLSLIKLIKEHFEEISITDFKDNNYIIRIKRNKNKGEKTIGFLFGLIEDNKKNFNIGQYFLQYSSLEQIFNDFAKGENREKNKLNIEINNELLDCFCK